MFTHKARHELQPTQLSIDSGKLGDTEITNTGYNQLQGTYTGAYAAGTRSISSHALLNAQTGDSPTHSLYPKSNVCLLRQAGQLFLKCLHEENYSVMRVLIDDFKICLPTSPEGICRELPDGSISPRRRASLQSGPLPDYETARTLCIFKNVLHIAIAHQNHDVVEMLLSVGCDANTRSSCECRPFRNAYKREARTGNYHRSGICLSFSCRCLTESGHHFLNQSPLELAIAYRDVYLLATLAKHGADIAAVDDKGNSPLLRVVRQSPLCWEAVECLLLLGARIHQRNADSVCPLDLLPEVARFQHFCIEECIKIASLSNDSQSDTNNVGGKPAATIGIGSLLQVWRTGHTALQMQTSHASTSPRHSKVLHSIVLPDLASIGSEKSVGTPTASFVHGQIHNAAPRRSLIPGQLHQKFKVNHERDKCASARGVDVSAVVVDDIWEALLNMASNSECIMALEATLLKNCDQLSAGENEDSQEYPVDKNLGKLLQRIIMTAMSNYEASTFSIKEKKELLVSSLSPLITICLQMLRSGRHKVQFTAILTLNKLVDTGIKLELFDWPQYEVISSAFDLHSFFGSSSPLTLVAPKMPYNHQNTRDQEKQAKKFYCPDEEAQDNLPESIYSGDETLLEDAEESEFYMAFKQIEPTTVVTMLHNCVTLLKRTAAKPKCAPSHRWRSCQHHCAAVLCSRLLFFLCHMRLFSANLNNEQVLKVLINLLDVELDSQILCLILQSLCLLALNPSCHILLQDLQIEDNLIQLLLPADDWFYTNHTTIFGQFVKHHAARILVYLGLGDRVGSRVNLFQIIGDNGSINNLGGCDEDQYICETCGPQTSVTLPGHNTYHTLESLINKIAGEMQNELEAVEEEFARRQSNTSNISQQLTIPNAVPQPLFALDTQPTQLPQAYVEGPLTSTNVHTYLSQLTSFVDPVILLRLLLHKLSWDVGLIRRPKKITESDGTSTHPRVSQQNSTHTSCNQDNRKWSCVSDPTSNSYIKPGMEKSSSFTVNQGDSSSSSAARLSAVTSALKKSSSLKFLFSTNPRTRKIDKVGSMSHKNVKRTQSGGNSKGINGSNKYISDIHHSTAHLPKYIQHLFRRRTGSAPKQTTGRKRHQHYRSNHRPRVDTDASISSADSEAIYEFQRRLQNYPVSRRPPVKQKSLANQSNDSNESRNSRSMQGSPIPEHQAGSDKSTSFLIAALVEKGDGFPKEPPVAAPCTDYSEIPYCGMPRMSARGSVIEPAVTVPNPHAAGAGKATLTLPAIEVRRPSTFSQHSSPGQPFPDLGSLQPLISPSNDSGHSMPLPSPPFDPPRAGSSFSTRSSGGSVILITSNRSSRGPSVGSCESGPFLFSFRMRRRSATFGSPTATGSIMNVPAASPIGGHKPTKALTAELHILRHLLLVCLKSRDRMNSHLIGGMKETGDLLRQILNVSTDPGVHQWCAEVINVVSSQGMDEDMANEEDEKLNDEYLEAQELIVGGNLPVPREDAAQLAGIQICIEENWPENKRKQIIRKHLMKGQFGRAREMANKIMVTPWELDQNLFCTPPRKPVANRKNRSLLGGEQSSSDPAVNNSDGSPSLGRRSPKNLLSACFIESPEGQLSMDLQEQCLPPCFRGDRRTGRLIKEKKRKLFHSRVFESEEGMKSLYVQTCRKLPAWGCRVFNVKELVHGHAFKKNLRLLCMSPQTICLLDADTKLKTRQAETQHLAQWRVGGGVAKHQVVLEFRATKWHLIVGSRSGLKGISMTLWEVLQNDVNLHHSLRFCRPHMRSLASQGGMDAERELQFSSGITTLYGLELERLQHIFQFPEEVALQLTSVEYDLFYNVQPLDYVRYVSCDLTSIPSTNQNPSPLKSLVKRFAEVSSWITHLIVSQPSQEERRVILGLILRCIETCCNIGNFNTAVELLTGLKSDKLKPFWLLIKTEEKQHFIRLCEFLMPSGSTCPAPEYVAAMKRGMRMQQSRLIPFFGTFLRDLYAIVNDVPSIIVIQHQDNKQRLEFLSDFQGEDHFTSRMGVGGLLNMDKIKLVGIVLENVEAFHRHFTSQKLLSQEMDALMSELRDCFPRGGTNGAPAMQTQHPYNAHPNEDKKDTDFSDCPYEPIQPVSGSSHGVSLIPLHPSKIDVDMIQRLQHGMTVIHFDQEASRSAVCRLQLDASCALMVWSRYSMASSNSSGAMSTSIPPIQSQGSLPRSPNVYDERQEVTNKKSGAYNNASQCSTMSAFGGPDVAFPGVEEGLCRLNAVKRVEFVESWAFDMEAIYKRHSMEEMSVPVNCWKVTYGSSLSENERLYFLAPQLIAQTWVNGLLAVTALLREQMWQADRRVYWLKTLYLDLFHDLGVSSITSPTFSGSGPKPVDALHAFGGFVSKWKNQFLSVSPGSGMNVSPGTPSRYPPGGSSSGGSSSIYPLGDGAGSKSNFAYRVSQAVKARVKGSSPSTRPRSRDSHLTTSTITSNNQRRSGWKDTTPRASVVSADSANASTMTSKTLPSHPFADDNSTIVRSVVHMDEASEPDDISVSGRSQLSFRSRKNTVEGVSETSASNSSREYQEKPLTFPEFLQLYKSFLIRKRKDLRNLFGEHSSNISNVSGRRCSGTGSMLKSGRDKEKRLSVSVDVQKPAVFEKTNDSGHSTFITNDWISQNVGNVELTEKQLKIYNALAVASVQCNAALDTSKTECITVTALRNFSAQHQLELISEADAIKLIKQHEPDPIMQMKNQLSFEGFCRYLMDRRNFAFVPEDIVVNSDEFQYPLSYYYIASSHNTYLTGHQLKGESSAELYEQVLLTGCRCVELDCWDGDDGYPVIYHGHTFTSKISFKVVINIVKRSAFLASSLPVILSIENHCSLLQQIKMAQMFRNTFGDRLVTHFLFDSDFSDKPQLPSPIQLQGKIILKNKKLVIEPERPLAMYNRVSDRKESKQSLSDDEDDDEDFEEEMDEFADEEYEQEPMHDSDSPRFSRQGSSEKLNKNRRIKVHTEATRQDSLSSEASGGDKPKSNDLEVSLLNDKSKRPLKNVMNSSMNKEDSTKRAGNKKSNVVYTQQIAQELSDMIIYCQAVKFKGFTLDSESNDGYCAVASYASQRISEGPMRKGSVREFASMTSSTLEVPLVASRGNKPRVTSPREARESSPLPQQKRALSTDSEIERPSSSSGYQSITVAHNQRKQPGAATCYQVASLNETAARKLCRKQPMKLIAYSKDHILRTYPAAMRIDSSNFDPLKFWCFGIQMVALNYQTQDLALALNQCLFESFGNSGYCLKPRVLWDPSHRGYRRFNPLGKEFAGMSAVHLTLTIISGQNVCPSVTHASPCVEVEILGIAIDSTDREKTKSAQRNALNPIWNQTFNFRVHFLELAFLKLVVTDSSSSKQTLQRILPLKHMRPGYRHVRLRSVQTNQPVDQASLFVYSRLEEEEYIHVEDGGTCISNSEENNRQQLMLEIGSRTLPMLKRQVYVLRIYGLQADDSPMSVHAQQSTTVRQVISMALQACMRINDNPEDYLLLEEKVGVSSTVADRRILTYDQLIMDAVALWNGNKAKFMCKRKGNDPSSRAWISSIIKSSVQTQNTVDKGGESQSRDTSVEPPFSSSSPLPNKCDAEADSTFLVCVHNVSADQPYAILRAPVNSTAQDVIIQVLLKARRMDRPADMVLVEELTFDHSSGGQPTPSSKTFKKSQDKTSDQSKKEIVQRILRPEEKVCQVQNSWKTVGRLVLQATEYAAQLEKSTRSRRKSSSPRTLTFPRMPKFKSKQV